MTYAFTRIDTDWTRALRRGDTPSRAQMREHLLEVHRTYAGFTESCALRCRDAQGRNSYEWLAELVDPERHDAVLDLGCGSGILGEICLQSPYVESLIGVDMSAAELALAERRLSDERATFHRGLAQHLDFLERDEVDVVLCHWALTLMDPVEPVLSEIARVMRPGGVFGAIVDGDLRTGEGYDELNSLIFSHVAAECPGYADTDLGDPRVRSTEELVALVSDSIEGCGVVAEPGVVALTGTPATIAKEAVRFFYASFVLDRDVHRTMAGEVEAFFEARSEDGEARFEMPINRLVVRAL